jgi:nucleotide-binding universal stress UspA family protein
MSPGSEADIMTSRRSPERSIVVGTDGSDAARPALVWALAAAAARGVRLDVVHAWQVPRVRSDGRPASPAAEAEDARRADIVLDREIDAARALTTARPAMRGLTRQGGACQILLEHATTADLLVLGAGGSGGRGASGIGSVTSRCLQRSPTPVAVVPVTAHHRRNGTRARFAAEIGVLEAMNPGVGAALHEVAGLTRHPSEPIEALVPGGS